MKPLVKSFRNTFRFLGKLTGETKEEFGIVIWLAGCFVSLDSLYGIYWKPFLSVLYVVLLIYMYFLLLYGSMAGNDAWNVFICTFADFKQIRFKFEIVIFRDLYRYICIHIYIYTHTCI